MRHTFLCLNHASDCAEECEVTVERGPRFVDDPCLGGHWYTLVSYPSSCKCGRPVLHCDPSQADLKTAYELPEAEDM